MVERGEIDPARAARMQALFDTLERHYASRMSPAEAAAEASERTLQRLAIEAADAKRRTLLQWQAQERLRGEMAGFDGHDAQAAALAVLDHDWRGRARYSNVEARRKAIMGQAHGMIAGLLERHGRGRLSGAVRHPVELDDLVAERFGEASGNPQARALSDAFGEAAEWLRRRFNAAGGAIGQLDRWGLPTVHDSLAVRQVAKDDPLHRQLEGELRLARRRGDRDAEARLGEAMVALSSRRWRDAIAPRLDRARMIDADTGEAFTDEALDQVLDGVYRTIRSDGWATRAAGSPGGPAALASRRAEHRFLHFRSAGDWRWYNDRFGGGGGAFEAMVGHLEGMARDVAHLEILGPNPAAMVRWLKDVVDQAHAVSPDTVPLGKRAESFLGSIDQLYAATSGALSTPVDSRIAKGFASTRAMLVAAQLGSATISAISDAGWQMMTRIVNGLPLTGYALDFARQFGPAERRASIRAGLIAEDASRLLHASNRFVENEAAGKAASWLAERVMNLSLLSQWTQAGKWAFGMGFLGHLADVADRPLGAIGGGFEAALRRYGFTAADWDAIRATPLHEPDGRALLRPQDVADARLGERLLEMILTETDAAVPVPTARGRAMLSFGQRPGSLGGEIIRSIGQYKSFGVSLMLIHGGRMMAARGGGRVGYAAGAMLFGTTLGALALWLRDLRNGQDPRPMTTPGFWGQAALQGVGFGPFGDYLTAVTSERTGAFGTTVAGATTGGLADLGQLLLGNGAETVGWLAGPETGAGGAPKGWNAQTRAGREAVAFARRYTPGTNLWYLRLAAERGFFDQMQRIADPDYQHSWDARERSRAERGSASWWPAGEAAPVRGPDWDVMREGPDGG
jgi:hypothetical protein